MAPDFELNHGHVRNYSIVDAVTGLTMPRAALSEAATMLALAMAAMTRVTRNDAFISKVVVDG